MIDLTELKALAEKATPGKWTNSVTGDGVHGDQDADGWTVVAQSPCERSPLKSARRNQWNADAAFIAAVNPATVLEIIAETERLRDAETRRARLAEEYAEALNEIERLRGALMPFALKDVIEERARQQSVEGWSTIHDDRHASEELALAAACYALPERARQIVPGQMGRFSVTKPRPKFWPWSAEWWKPSDRRRDLVKAAALIMAEIERLDRARAELESKT